MNDNPSSKHAASPAIGWGGIFVFLAIAIVFGAVSFWQYAPPIDALRVEDARVQKVWRNGYATTTTSLQTISGQDVSCMNDKTGGCHPEAMKDLLASKTPVTVWHDGKHVYQLTVDNRTLLAYEHFNQGRWFAGVIAFVFLVVAMVQIGILKGVIGIASRGEDLRNK